MTTKQNKRRFPKKAKGQQEVRTALQKCQSMTELLDFLFSTDHPRDKALLRLFEQRIRQLDAEYQAKTILHF